MSLTERFEKRAYPMFLSVAILTAVAIQLKIFMGTNLSMGFVFVLALLEVIGIFVVEILAKNPKLYIFFGVVLAVGAVVAWMNWEIFFEYITTNKDIRVIGLILLIGIAVYISQQFFVLRLLVCIGYWGAMFVILYMKLFPVRQVMFCLAAELIMVIAEVRDRILYRKEEKRNKKMFFLSPVVLVMVLFLSFLPYSKEPFKWERLKRVVEFVTDTFEIWINGLIHAGDDILEFDIGFSGYSDSANIYGDKITIDNEALKLNMLGNKENIYLVGNIKSDYTGKGWKNSPTNTEYDGVFKEYELDTVEFMYALHRAGILKKTNMLYIRSRKLEVEYDSIYTSSLFRPAKTMVVTPEANKGKIDDTGDNIKFTKNQNGDTRYTLNYFAINRSSEHALEFIRSQCQYKYSTISEEEYTLFRRAVNSDYAEIELPRGVNIEAELRQRADYIRDAYCGVPGRISEATYKLAEDLTKDCTNDYDKMMAIIEYLSEYEYTTSPGSVPKGKDVVEYFLHESKKGYCTYFASAAAILGRCVGIPTRYVQGYLLNIMHMEEHGNYSVKNNQAHAWIECYLEGVGWLTFEPTSGNSSLLYEEWDLPEHLLNKENDSNKNPEESDDTGTEEEEPEEELPEEEETEEEELKEEEPKKEELIPEEEEEDNTLPTKEIIRYVALGLIVMIIIYVAYLKISERRFWRHYEKASAKERVRLDMWMILWILEHAGHPIEEGETLTDYANRMESIYPDKGVILSNVSRIYMKLRYSVNYEATKEEQRMAQRLRLSFMDKTVKEGAMARAGLKIL